MASTAPITGSLPGKIRTFLLDHERLIIIVIAAILIYAGYVKVTNVIAAHDEAQLKQAQIVANQQADVNKALAVQVTADAAQLKELSDKLTAQNQQLANANTALATALITRQKTDATLPPTDLAIRWSQLVPNMPSAGVTVSTDGTFKVSQAAGLATTQQLEQVPTLTKELANETLAKQNDDQLIDKQGKSIFDLNASVTGLNKQIVDNNVVCQDQIKVVKDEARKSKRRWFIIGYVAGFLSRQFLGPKF